MGREGEIQKTEIISDITTQDQLAEGFFSLVFILLYSLYGEKTKRIKFM